MEWIVTNALSRDVEREHLNKILKEIKSEVSSASNGGVSEARVLDLIKSNIPASSGNTSTNGDIKVTLTGDVTGSGSGKGSISIAVKFNKPYPEDDGTIQWYRGGDWYSPSDLIVELESLEASTSEEGFLVYTNNNNPEETMIHARSIQAGYGIEIENSNGVEGNPVVSIAPIIRAAGEEISALRLVYEDADGVYLLDPSIDSNVAGLLGITLTAASESEDIRIRRYGSIEDSGWAWDQGFVFAGPSGTLTQTYPDDGWEIVVGYAPTATKINLTFDEPVKLA